MSLKDSDRRIIVELELEKAEKTFSQVSVQVEAELWDMAANRLYYALFHAVSAMLILDKHEVGTHRGAVSRFSLFYIKPGIFTKEEGRLYSQLQSLREDGDYNCSIDVINDEVISKIAPTRNLIQKIISYIQERISSDCQ